MRLDTKALRYLTTEDWRVLTAVEQGSRNHEVVPTPLIAQLAHLRSGAGGAHRSISTLAKVNLIARVKNARYDGYRLTYGGLDYLALHSHSKSGAVYSVGNQVGTGKESDVFVCAAGGAAKVGDGDGDARGGGQRILKVHRLGRISFRTVKNNRDYLRKQRSGSWMHMSRLAALKEYTFMGALREAGFRVPLPLAHNRHTVVMELVDAFPLRQISHVPDPASLYADLMQTIVDLAAVGLIHGDFNEFNILIREDEVGAKDGQLPETQAAGEEVTDETSIKLTPVIIDFPQMVSTEHQNAQMYFDRDVDCIKRFFQRRFGFTSDDSGPHFADAKRQKSRHGSRRLDVVAEASGFSKKMGKELEQYMQEVGATGDRRNGSDGGLDEDDDSEDEDSEDSGSEHDDDDTLEPEDTIRGTHDAEEAVTEPHKSRRESDSTNTARLSQDTGALLDSTSRLNINGAT